MACLNHKRDKERTQPIQVFVRARPLNKQELESHCISVIEILNTKELTFKQQYGKRYSFDRIFPPSSKQIDIYTHIVQPLIPEVLAGYNCTVFAYGQTGTGKTYTMAGGSATSDEVSWQDDLHAGIVPRALNHLFNELSFIQQEYTVRVSYLELYNEELFDLLADTIDPKGIRLFDDQHQKGSVLINGLTKETVYNKHQVYKILQKGQEKRKTATTLLNESSSRSHTVFSIMVHTREMTPEGEELFKTGKLNLVDLAGSENVNRSGAVDRRAREAGNINQSLLTLGRVIKALVEKSVHIPYRESKLTRILQDSLGGRTKTSIIATISPAISCLEETQSTLDYAYRARNITNKPEINQKVSHKQWKVQLEKEIERLNKDLQAARTGTGVVLAQENYDRLLFDNEMQKEEIEEKIALIKYIEEQKTMQETEWAELKQSFEETQQKLVKYRNLFKKTAIEKKEQEHLATSYESRATILQTTAKDLEEIVNYYNKKINDMQSVCHKNNDNTQQICLNVTNEHRKVVNHCQQFHTDFQEKYNGIFSSVNNFVSKCQNGYTKTANSLCTIHNSVKSFFHSTCKDLKAAVNLDSRRQKRFINNVDQELQEINILTEHQHVHNQLETLQNQYGESSAVANGLLVSQQTDITEFKEELQIINELLQSLSVRVNNLTDNFEKIETRNAKCLTNYNATNNVVNESLLSIVNDLNKGTAKKNSLVNDLTNVLNKTRKQEAAVVKLLDELMDCQPHLDDSYTEELKKEAVKTINSEAIDQTEFIEKMLGEMITESNGMQNLLSLIENNLSLHNNYVVSKLDESQNMLNSANEAVIDVAERGDTPVRPKINYDRINHLTPKEEMLSRFRRTLQDLSFKENLEESFTTDPAKSSTSVEENSSTPAEARYMRI